MLGHIAFTVCLGLLPLAVGLWLRQRLRTDGHLPLRTVLLVATTGAGVGLFSLYLAHLTEVWLSAFDVLRGGAAWLRWLVRAPLVQLSVGLVVLVLERRHHGLTRRDCLGYATVAQAGFTAVVVSFLAMEPPSWLGLFRALLAIPGYLFAAGLWGYALGAPRRRALWLSCAMCCAIGLHTVWDHMLFERGPGVLVVLLPLILVISLLSANTLHALRGEHGSHATRDSISLLLASLPDPPSLSELRESVGYGRHRIRVGWVMLGGLVYVGATLCSLGLAVYLGNRWGIDFTLADEADLEANAPLLLIGTAIVAAYPVAGYLQARASDAKVILEPALAAALTLGLAVAIVSTAETIALALLLSISPLALILASAGAWWASHRERARRVRVLQRHALTSIPSGQLSRSAGVVIGKNDSPTENESQHESG